MIGTNCAIVATVGRRRKSGGRLLFVFRPVGDRPDFTPRPLEARWAVARAAVEPDLEFRADEIEGLGASAEEIFVDLPRRELWL